MQTISLCVRADGRVTGIYDDELAGLCDEGKARIERASHVEPAPDGGWTADLGPVGGPVLGPFPLRAEALAAEVQWLKCKLF